MAVIGLQKASISSIRRQIEKMQAESENAEKKIRSALNGLDFEVASKKNLQSRLKGLKSSAERQSAFGKQYENAFLKVTETLVDADNKYGSKSNSIFDKIREISDGTLKNISLFFMRNKFQKYMTVCGMFLGGKAGISITDMKKLKLSDYLKNLWSGAKNSKKTVSFLKDIMNIVNNGVIPEEFKDFFSNEILDTIGDLQDIEKLVDAAKNMDLEKLSDLLGKYGITEPLKDFIKDSGVAGADAGAGCIADIAWATLKNTYKTTKEYYMDIYNVIKSGTKDWKDYAKCLSSGFLNQCSIPFRAMFDVVGDKADNIAKIADFFGISDYKTQFVEYTGNKDAGIKDFYIAAGNDIIDMYRHFGFKDTTKILADSFRDTIKDQMSGIGKTISRIFS